MQKNYLTLVLIFCTLVAFAQDGDFHLDKEFNINKNGTIDLSISDAKVFITGSKRSTAHIKIDRKVTVKGWGWGEEDFRVDVDENAGDLKIREHHTGNGNVTIGYYREEYKIEIGAPEGVALIVHGDDGDYFITNINGSITMNTDDADIELSGCKGNQFSFRLGDGDLRMDAGQGSLEINVNDADVNIRKGRFSSIRAQADDGDLIVETSLAENGTYDFRSQDGLVALNVTEGGGEFDIRHADGRVQALGNFKTNFESEVRTKLSLAQGNSKVTMRIDDGRVKLTAN